MNSYLFKSDAFKATGSRHFITQQHSENLMHPLILVGGGSDTEIKAFIVGEESPRHSGFVSDDQTIPQIRIDLFVLSGFNTIGDYIMSRDARFELQHYSGNSDLRINIFKNTKRRLRPAGAQLPRPLHLSRGYQ